MRKINAVVDNKDKARTYKVNCSKYKKAIQEEFYFEAMLISYAVLEDRLRSFLYHIGALANRNSIKINCMKTKNQLKDIVSLYKSDKENESLGITNITGKIKIIRCTLEWELCVNGGYEDDKYLVSLKNQYESNIDVQDALKTLAELFEWLDYRNEIIHALLNKNIDSLHTELKERTLQGMELARKIDSFVSCVKKRNYIRRSIGLCVEK